MTKEKLNEEKVVLSDGELELVVGGDSPEFNDSGGACQAIPAIRNI